MYNRTISPLSNFLALWCWWNEHACLTAIRAELSFRAIPNSPIIRKKNARVNDVRTDPRSPVRGWSIDKLRFQHKAWIIIIIESRKKIIQIFLSNRRYLYIKPGTALVYSKSFPLSGIQLDRGPIRMMPPELLLVRYSHAGQTGG